MCKKESTAKKKKYNSPEDFIKYLEETLNQKRKEFKYNNQNTINKIK